LSGWRAVGALSWAQAFVPNLMELVSPETVIDVGCGVGAWTSQWSSAIGVDGDWVPRDQLLIPESSFLAHDLTQPLKLGRRADLVLCLEVAEHLPQGAGRTLVESLCKHGSVVAFSAAVPGQDGVDHI